MKRALLQIACILLLLVAQHGALTHQVQHLQDHLPGQSQQHDDGKQESRSGLCDFHTVFAQMFGGVSSSVLPLRLAANTVERGARQRQLLLPATLLVPASRGPPVLL